MADDGRPVEGEMDELVDRIVVRLPLRMPTAVRVLSALAREFPCGRWVDDPDGHLAIEVSLADGGD